MSDVYHGHCKRFDEPKTLFGCYCTAPQTAGLKFVSCVCMVIGMDTQTVRCLIDFKSMGNLPPAEKLSYEQTDGKRVTFAASRSAEREVVRRIISRTHI